MTAIIAQIGLFLKGVSLKTWAIIGAILIVVGAVWLYTSSVDDRVEEAEQTGQVIERNKQLEETIKNVETADEARKEIAKPGSAGDLVRYNQCLRTARTPENCKRFLPDVQQD